MRQIDFAGAVHRDIPVEVIVVSELIGRIGAAHITEVQRLSLGVMLIVRDGVGSHVVDFEAIPLMADRVVFARPGQVQQWGIAAPADAVAVIARPELCPPDSWFPGHASYRDLGKDSMATAVDVVSCLQREQHRFAADHVSIRLLGSLFSALAAVFDRADAHARTTELPEPYVAFRSALEDDVTRSRDARVYMADVSFSERTINRACRRATGLTAKGVVDQRITLEARRLLAHTDLPVSVVARRLGFTEAANFDKYFARLTGQRPSEFRSALRDKGFSAARVTDP